MKSRGPILLLLFAFLAVHRLPAPIQETQGTPSPSPSPIKPTATSKSKAGRFAGTWSGIVNFKDPFVGGGGAQQCDFIINSEENSMTIRVSKVKGGSYHMGTARVMVIGNTASAKGGFLKHISTTLTLTGDETTADVVVHDSIWGTSSGTVKKVQ